MVSAASAAIRRLTGRPALPVLICVSSAVEFMHIPLAIHAFALGMDRDIGFDHPQGLPVELGSELFSFQAIHRSLRLKLGNFG